MPEPDEPKKETVRITLPPRGPASPAEERDTTQINRPIDPETTEETSPAPPPPAPRPGSLLARPPLRPAGAQVIAPLRRTVPPPPMPASPAKLPVTPPLPPRIMPAPAPNSAFVPPRPVIAKIPPPPLPATPVTAAPPTRPGPGAQPKKETSRIDTVPTPKKETSRINLVPDEPPKTRMSKTQPLVTLTATAVTPPFPPVRVAPALERTSVISSIPTSLCWALVLISAAILIIEIWTYIS